MVCVQSWAPELLHAAGIAKTNKQTIEQKQNKDKDFLIYVVSIYFFGCLSVWVCVFVHACASVFKKNFIMIYNVLAISAIQQNDPVNIYIHSFSHIIFHHVPLQMI